MSSTDLERRIQARLQKHQQKLREHKSRIVDHQEWLKTMASSVLGEPSDGGGAPLSEYDAANASENGGEGGAPPAGVQDMGADPGMAPSPHARFASPMAQESAAQQHASPARVHISRHGSVSILAGGAMPPQQQQQQRGSTARVASPPQRAAPAVQFADSAQFGGVSGRRATGGRRPMDYQSRDAREVSEMRATVRRCSSHSIPGRAASPVPLTPPFSLSLSLSLRGSLQPKIDANSRRLAASRRPKGAHVTQHLFDHAASLEQKRLLQREAAKREQMVATKPRITARGRMHVTSTPGVSVSYRLFDEAKARRERAEANIKRQDREDQEVSVFVPYLFA
jgi:hypothetical protein